MFQVVSRLVSDRGTCDARCGRHSRNCADTTAFAGSASLDELREIFIKMEKLNQMVEHAMSDYATQDGEAMWKLGDIPIFQGIAAPDALPPPQIGVAREHEKGGEVARDFEQIFRPQRHRGQGVANPREAPVFYGRSSFVLPDDATWKVLHHPGPYLNPPARPVEEGSSDEESGESVVTGTSSDSAEGENT